MKKRLMLLAAGGMLLFAACEKNDRKPYTIAGDHITFNFSMGVPNDSEKQAYDGPLRRIFFTSGDQMYINGQVCAVTPLATSSVVGSTASYSPYGSATADLSSDGSYKFVYPAAPMAVDTASGMYATTMPEMVVALDIDQASGDFSNIVAYDSQYVAPVWPMSFGTQNIEQETEIVLKNTCAFFAPRVCYSNAVANVLFSPITGQTYSDSNPAPALTIEKGFIGSRAMRLGGDVVLDDTDADNPYMSPRAGSTPPQWWHTSPETACVFLRGRECAWAWCRCLLLTTQIVRTCRHSCSLKWD